MKKIIYFLLFLCAFFLEINVAAEGKVIEKNNGFYFQAISTLALGSGVVTYIVDTKAQLCYADYYNEGVLIVPCANLRKRTEWQSVITWIDSNKDAQQDAPAERATGDSGGKVK